MSIWIEKDEATAARRRVPARIFLSDGTSPDTGALNDAVIMGTNSLGTFSVNSTLRAVNANNGMYCIELTQSEVSVLGSHPLYHTVGDFCQHFATVQVVNSNPMSTLSAISNVTLWAGNHSGASVEVKTGGIQTTSVGKGNYSGVSVEVTTGGIQTVSVGKGNYSGVSVEVTTGGIQTVSVGKGSYSGVSVEIATKGIATNSITTAAIYSALTIGGIDNITPRVYSGVSTEVKAGGIQTTSVGVGNYSGVSVEVKAKGIAISSIETANVYSALTIGGISNIAPGTFSGVSVEIKTGGIQTTSVGVGNYSGVSVEVKTGGIQVASVGQGTYSGVTVGINNIAVGVSTTSRIAAAVWDDPASLHIVKDSYGAILQPSESNVATGGTVSSITLGSTATTVDGYYVGQAVMAIWNDGTPQVGIISRYTGSSRAAYIAGSFTSIPGSSTTYVVYPWTPSWVTAIAAGTYSGVSVEVKAGGIQASSVGAGNYSGVSVEVKTGGIQATSMGAGNYSGVSVEVKTKGIATSSIETANIYSALTIGGITNIAAGTFSGVTIQGVTRTLSLSANDDKTGYGVTSIAAGNYSGVSVEVKSGGIQTTSIGAGSYSGVTIDGAKFLSVAGERSVASSLLSTNLGNNRFVQQAIEVLRNRVFISGSTMTVYQTDDATSSWTASVTTGTDTLTQIDPGGL